MAKKKFDGVVEAVHYDSDGQLGWVRVYLRRRQVYTDRIILDRQTLIDDLKVGKRYLVGKRVPQMGATFEVSDPVNVLKKDGQEILVVGAGDYDRDTLTGVPRI